MAGSAVTCVCVVVVLGSALTVMTTLFEIVGSFTEVAVMVAVPAAPEALKVTERDVMLANAVHAGPV